MEEKKHRLAWPLRALIILILLGIAAFGLLVGYICIQEGKVSREVTAIKEPYEAVIVLGAQVRPDGTPSVQLSWRLDAAAEALDMPGDGTGNTAMDFTEFVMQQL